MSKSNFSFLNERWPILTNLGELAEKYLYTDSNTSLIKLRLFGETVVKLIFQIERIEAPSDNVQKKKINMLKVMDLIDNNIYNILHDIRRTGNKASHDAYASEIDGRRLLKESYILSVWFMQTYGQYDFVPDEFVLSDRKNINPIIEKDRINELNKNIQEYELSASINNSEDEVKIGSMVRNTFRALVDKGIINSRIMMRLQDEEYSKVTFGINYPFAKVVNKAEPLSKQRNVNNYPRYWKKIYRISGDEYILCNDWYIRNKEKYIGWVYKIGGNSIFEEINLKDPKSNSVDNNSLNVVKSADNQNANRRVRKTYRDSISDEDKLKINKVAYYLSLYEHEGLFSQYNQTQAFEKIAQILKINKNTLKNKRDAYDPYCNEFKTTGRKRRGWWQTGSLSYDMQMLKTSLEILGLHEVMNVIAHSSLSSFGYVEGGASLTFI